MTTKAVRLARDFAMPLEAVTEKFAILGNSGMGKTAVLTTFIEQLYKAGLPSVVLDVKGDHWGIRSSRDGKGPGLPFVIFGGEHGDVPLEPTAGTLIADSIVDYQMSAILDLSLMSKRKARTFTAAFAEQLYHRNRDPLMVVVDEADVLIPQRPDAETWRLVGAMEDIAKRGRGHGLGLTIASQRGQEVNQSVLDILSNVILLGMTGRLTIKAVRDWINVNAANDEVSAHEVIGSLPSMAVGEAWVWSPSFMRVVKRVRMNMFTTFDSKMTPKVGERRIVPVKRAEVDLAKLGEEFAATVERAKAADPSALKAKVAHLTRTLETREREMQALRADMEQQLTAEPIRVEVPALPEDFTTMRRIAQHLAGSLTEQVEKLTALTEDASHVVERLTGWEAAVTAGTAEKFMSPRGRRVASTRTTPATPAPAVVTRRPRPAVAPASAGESIGSVDRALNKAERAVLSALAPYAPNPRSAKQVALISQYSSKGGGFRNSLGSLRGKGLIVGSNSSMVITDEGLAALGDYEPLPTGAALVEHWCSSSVLGRAEAATLRAIVAAYPDEISAGEVAEVAGYEPGGGGFRNALGKLRSLELIVGGNSAMRASDELID